MDINYEEVKKIVENKLINKTETRGYEELSEFLFGDGNCFNESEVRKRMYGMKRLIEIIENEEGARVHKRILSISDLHVPFQLPIETFDKYIGRVDILQINGDVTDCQAISKFPKVYRVSPMEEIIETRKYLMNLIAYLSPKKVVVTYGNHDIRFQDYLSKNLDTDILELMPRTSLELIIDDGFNHYNKKCGTKSHYDPLYEVIDGVEIDYVNNWHCQIGETIFCHPFVFSSGIMKTSEKAMQWFRNEGYQFSSLIMGHTHRVGECTIGNTTLYEQGCCCDTKKLKYADGRLVTGQKEGFIYICHDVNGKVIREKTQLIVLS